MGNLERIQTGLKKLWTEEGYSDRFKKSPLEYKHFDHTLKHIRKAVQVLENLTEEADHGNVAIDDATLKKCIADIVISAVRLGNVWPADGIDVEGAVFDRIEKKMNAKIEKEADGEEKRLNEKIFDLKTVLWNRVRVWNDANDRNYMLCDLCGSPEGSPHKSPCALA